jgi:thymidylate synthase (FAD)
MANLRFTVKTIAATPQPQTLVWRALHQDYSSQPVWDAVAPSEFNSGTVAISRLLSGGRGHFGCLEHPSISFNCVNFPHSVMQQARTHRVGITFDVQSFRYTSESVLRIEDISQVEQSFYFRTAQAWRDRSGHLYFYTEEERNADIENTYRSVERYKYLIGVGVAEEHAREVLTTNYRQHFVVSFNCRSLMHFLDLRGNLDAQWEIRQLSEGLLAEALLWMPEIFGWYKDKRFGKAKLSP